MQPPPRKVKHTAVLKNIHSEQLSKLQAKHQHECELLEDIRNFSRQRSIIEKEYAQSLLKLTSQLLKRDFPAMPDLPSEDGKEHRTAIAVWRVILEETEKVAQARLQAAETYLEKIAEPAKPLKASKVQCLKKMIPQLSTVQQEVAQSVLEMSKAQKIYNVDENISHDARQKAGEAEDRLKKKSTGLFQSMASLQKNFAKLNSRQETCESKSTQSRNEYLLNMAASNSHHIRYYSTELPEIMRTLDGEIFEKIQEFFSLFGKTAADVGSMENSCFENISSQADMISRQYNLQCFLYCNRVFTDLLQYHFEPCQNDQCSTITKEQNAAHQLEKEARKWATKIAKETRAMRDYSRTLRNLQGQSGSDKVSDSGTEVLEQNPEQKIEELRQNIRKSETAKLKAEARIEALRNADVDVEEWLSSCNVDSLGVDDEGITRTPSQQSLRTESSGGPSEDQEPTYTHYEDFDIIDDTFEIMDTSIGSNRSSHRVYPVKCVAMYDFQANNHDELSMGENEELEIVADGDGDGWVKAKNSDGDTGYIPETYVQIAGEEQKIGISTNDVNIYSHTQPVPSAEEMSQASTNDTTHEVTSSYSSGDLEVQQTTNQMFVDNPEIADNELWARALYDYCGNTDEELTFTEGTLIKVMRKDENGIDDGFWEGEVNGKKGVFPSLVVEELTFGSLSQNALTPMTDGPPNFTPPPPVTVTAATPLSDEPPSPLSNGTVTSNTDVTIEGVPVTQYYKKVRFSNNHIGQYCPRILTVDEFDAEFDEDGEESIV
ncbi:hypothetical protein ScPMuIL_011609 [Solemya velum]